MENLLFPLGIEQEWCCEDCNCVFSIIFQAKAVVQESHDRPLACPLCKSNDISHWVTDEIADEYNLE